MATNKQDIKNQQDLNQSKEEEISLESQIIDLLRTRRGIDSEIVSDQQDIANVIKDQTKQMTFQAEQRRLINSLSSKLTQISVDTYSITKDQLGLTKTNNDLLKKQETIDKSIIQLERERKELLKQGGQENFDLADAIGMQVKEAQNLKGKLEGITKTSKTISDNFGVKSFSGLSEITSKIPGLSKFSGPFKEASEAARSQAQSNLENFGTTKKISKENLKALKTGKGLNADKIKAMGLEGKLLSKNGKLLTGNAAAAKAQALGITKVAGKSMGPLMAGFKALGPMISKALGPIGLIVEAIQQFLQFDKLTTDVARNYGVSREEATQLVDLARQQSNEIESGLVSYKEVVKAQMDINKMFGTSVKITGDLAAEFAEVQKLTGLSGKAMEFFAKESIVGGDSIKKQLSEISAVTAELNYQTGANLNLKDIQESIATASKAQLLMAGRNTKELANQAFQAKLVGLNMNQLESVGSSLLNFEESIANEMAAELMTGKELNLEKARQAALEGDLATLAQEIRKEVGTAAEFGEMNVLQQEALAKAFGMQREDMAKMLAEQEELEALKAKGFESVNEAQEEYNRLREQGMSMEEAAAATIGEEAAKQMETASAQERLAAAQAKMGELFVALLEPLMPLIDTIIGLVNEILPPIMKALQPVFDLISLILDVLLPILMPTITSLFGALENIFGGIGDVLGGIVDLFTGNFEEGLKKIGSGIITLVVSPFQWIMDTIVGIINGLIEGANMVPFVDIPLLSTPDLIGGAKAAVGLAEGGVVTAPTTALIGEGGEPEAVVPLSKAKGMGFGGNNEETNALLRELIATVKQGGDVYMDSTKVGTAMAVGSYKVQ
jgi:DNA-binding XRE family transcriptional regulator